MVKNWYDGFTFGDQTDLYNPWSILKKKYAQVLIEKGISKKNIRQYGFAFCGKKVLIEGN
jgi:hypothetical protein